MRFRFSVAVHFLAVDGNGVKVDEVEWVGVASRTARRSEKEYDDVDATDNRILPAVHKIMLDALARGTASATFAAADKAEKSGDKGYLQEHDGGTVRVDGGRRMSLNVLDHLLRYGPG